MPKLWEITREEARLWGLRLRDRRAVADRIAAPTLARQLSVSAAEATATMEQSGDGTGTEVSPSTPEKI
jgi:hypothetical protein